MKYIIEISDGKKQTYYKRHLLHERGYVFNKSQQLWSMKTNDIKLIRKEKLFAKKHKFSFFYYEKIHDRSYDYRNKFFETFKPQISNYYICSYCGRLLKKDKVSVDHIIPISMAKNNYFIKNLISFLHIHDINDQKNLAPSCLKCNLKKGSKGNLWILRGFIGKHLSFWILIYSLIILFFIKLITLIMKVII